MAVCKCKMCGGDLNITELDKVVACDYCGTQQTVPSADNEKKMTLFNRANRLRLNSEFDKAAALYEQIAAEFPEEAEAYWGLCLCRYGIEYVDDPATGEKKPTCHRASFEKLSKDENYELAMEYADVIAQRVYRREAQEIDRINEEILSVSKNESPYDIFICYKETDEAGGRTPDSVMAQDIYDALTAKGCKVFFARISLEDKLGLQYEPYIFAALNSAKIMLSVGTKYEYFHAVWVKNEWSRFLRLAAKDKSKILIPCYKDMDPYDMPDEFKGLQAQDLGKLGAVQDLVRGVEKLLAKDAASVQAAPAQPVVAVPAGATVESLLKRAFMFLEDGEWQSADEYAEKVLDIDPENGDAYLAKFYACANLRRIEDIENNKKDYRDNAFYLKFIRFSNEPLRSEIRGVIEKTAEFVEKVKREKLDLHYAELCKEMNDTDTPDGFLALAEQFDSLDGFEDSDKRSKECRDKAVWIQTNNGTVVFEFMSTIRENGFYIMIDKTKKPINNPQKNMEISLQVVAGEHQVLVGTASGFQTKPIQFSIAREQKVNFRIRSTFLSYDITKL